MALEVVSSANTANASAANSKVSKTETATQDTKQLTKSAASAASTLSSQVEAQVVVKNDGSDTERNGQNNNESERIRSAVKRANSTMKTTKTRCEFSYHEDTNRVSITIYDKDTEEVIREIPSEETLELIQKMYEMAGILVDEKR